MELTVVDLYAYHAFSALVCSAAFIISSTLLAFHFLLRRRRDAKFHLSLSLAFSLVLATISTIVLLQFNEGGFASDGIVQVGVLMECCQYAAQWLGPKIDVTALLFNFVLFTSAFVGFVVNSSIYIRRRSNH